VETSVRAQQQSSSEGASLAAGETTSNNNTNYTSNSASVYFYTNTTGFAQASGYFSQNHAGNYQSGLTLYGNTPLNETLYFSLNGYLQEQSGWQQLQGGAQTQLKLKNESYVNSPFNFTYNNTLQRVTFSVANQVPGREFSCYSNNIQYAASGNSSHVVTGNVYYSIHNGTKNDIYGLFNYTQSAQSFYFYVTESSSALVATSYFYWHINVPSTSGGQVVFDINVPFVNVYNSDNSWVQATFQVGLFTNAPNSFFLLNFTNLYQHTQRQGFYLSDAWDTDNYPSKNETVFWNVLQNNLLWNNNVIYSYENVFNYITETPAYPTPNLLTVYITNNLHTQNNSNLVFNSSLLFEASSDDQAAALFIEDVDCTLTRSDQNVENFYLDSALSWKGVGKDATWAIKGAVDLIVTQRELFYTRININKNEAQ
jgi:hypothetical protein